MLAPYKALPSDKCDPSVLTVQSQNAEISFNVTVVDTEALRAKGLMYVDISPIRGLLFIQHRRNDILDKKYADKADMPLADRQLREFHL